MNKTFPLNPTAFRKKWLPLTLLMMTPSFLVDGVLFYRLFQFLPAQLARGETIPQILWEFLMLLFTNALLLKSVPLIIYFLLRHLRRLSHVQIKQKEVIYYKRLLVYYDEDFGYTFFHEYHIRRPGQLVRQADGAIRVEGEFEVACYHRDGTPVGDFRSDQMSVCSKQRKQCTIPGYFDGMEDIYRKLELLLTRQGQKST